MARNNVFKLSGNMALGSNDPYSNNEFDSIKSSLKLLKSKQGQKQQNMPLQPSNLYGGSYSSSIPSKQQVTSRNIPSNQYQNYNYPTNTRANNQGSGSYKDVYYQMEQNYPKNQYKSKRSNEEYNQHIYDRNDYQKQQKQTNQRGQPPMQKQPQRQDYRQQQRGSDFQQRNIKEINRQNRVEIKEYDPSQLIQCGQGCGRKFNPDSISKHEGVCRKVFQKKRKQFNTQQQRIVANQQKKLMKRGEMIDKKLQQKKARQKIPKWKAQSLQLRAGIKQARNDDYQPTKEQRQMLEAAKVNQFTKCQYCGRSFNEQAALKHIPFCESQQKKNQIKRR